MVNGILLLALLGAGDPQEPAPEGIGPFLKRHCVACHGPEKQKGKVALHALGEAPAPGPAVELWKRVFEKVESGAMPPEEAAQPSAEQRRRALVSIRGALEKAGERREGNEVDHDALFAPAARAGKPAATRARLWRLTGEAYEHSLTKVAGYDLRSWSPRSPWQLVPHKEEGFSDYPSFHQLGEAELEHHLRNSLPLARALVKRYRPLLEPKAPGDAVGVAFRDILERAPSAEERQRYAGFLAENLKRDAPDLAVQHLVLAVLVHPEVLYRVEVPAAGREGRGILAPRDLARAVAYALTDRGPDEALLKAAADGKLARPEDVRAHALRILNDPKIAKPRVLRFFQEYFGYAKAPDVFKDTPTLQAAGVARHRREDWDDAIFYFVYDTDRLVESILEEDRNVLRELLTTSKTFALTGPFTFEPARVTKGSYSRNERGFFWAKVVPVALRIYEIEEIATRRDAWSPDRPYPMPDGHRMGILTHPSWLIARSGNFANDAIRRGKWIRERLLGDQVPDVPVTVNAVLPDEPDKPLRERMRVTREAYCWSCHKSMDPLGLPFEMYDHFGRFRTAELGKPVDATGALVGTRDARLDGPVKDARDLIRRLADSKRVEQVFVRHVFRYFTGRKETAEDAPVLVEAHRSYVEGGGSMKALIVSLLASEAFLHRIAAEPERRNP